MSDNRQYWSCTRKRRYRKEKSAKTFLRGLRKSGVIVQFAEVYKCKYCDGWHVGHSIKNKKKEG